MLRKTRLCHYSDDCFERKRWKTMFLPGPFSNCIIHSLCGTARFPLMISVIEIFNGGLSILPTMQIESNSSQNRLTRSITKWIFFEILSRIPVCYIISFSPFQSLSNNSANEWAFSNKQNCRISCPNFSILSSWEF